MNRPTPLEALGPPRWKGQPGRTEVWYVTVTDQRTGIGIWVHHETVAPTGDGTPYAHGWIAVFEAEQRPVLERFGPEPHRHADDAAWHVVGDCQLGHGWLRGTAGTLAWDLVYRDAGAPLHTFPRSVWDRELLPGAQVVPAPDATVEGRLTIAGREVVVDGRGALARIYGHGSAQRWGWLHADLDGSGTLEIVTATARRPGLRRVPPLAMVQLRLGDGPDWPAHPLLAAPRFRTTLRTDGFDVRGRSGGRRLTVRVDVPADDAVALRYTDPDGATATCTNSERASATIAIRDGELQEEWHLDRVAHAEVGRRP